MCRLPTDQLDKDGRVPFLSVQRHAMTVTFDWSQFAVLSWSLP